MPETQTRPTYINPAAFIAAVVDPVRRADAETLCAMLTRLSGEPATMWGPSIIGFGRYSYVYDSGHSGEACRIGFSPRKTEQVLYALTGETPQAELLTQLGKHRTGKSCLYIRRLGDVDLGILEAVMIEALRYIDAKYPR